MGCALYIRCALSIEKYGTYLVISKCKIETKFLGRKCFQNNIVMRVNIKYRQVSSFLQATKALRVSRGIALFFHDRGTSRE